MRREGTQPVVSFILEWEMVIMEIQILICTCEGFCQALRVMKRRARPTLFTDRRFSEH
jgi:hypothetical protein